MRSKKRDKTMLGLVPLGIDIRLMPQTINMAKVYGFVLSQGVCPKSDRAVAAGRRPAPMGTKVPGALPFQSAIDVEVGADVVDKLLSDGRKWLVGKPYKAKGGVERLL